MQVDSRSGLYFLAEPRSLLSRGVIASENESTQRALRSFVCRIGPLQGAAYLRPARGSECSRGAYFCTQRATASINREKSWKVVAKKA